MSPAHTDTTRPHEKEAALKMSGAPLLAVADDQQRQAVLERSALGNRPCVQIQVKDVLARVGDKWSMCVVGVLYSGPVRFNEIRRRSGGVSQRMLTLTLCGLERDGLVTRAVYATNPPSVEYTLTELGHTLVGPVLALVQWSEAHLTAIQQARATFDEQATPTAGTRVL